MARLDTVTLGKLLEVHHRKGFRFIHESTKVTLPELLKALSGGEIRIETATHLTNWTKQRLELVVMGESAKPFRTTCPACGQIVKSPQDP